MKTADTSSVSIPVRVYEGTIAEMEKRAARIHVLEAALREVQSQWWPGCKPIQERIALLLGPTSETAGEPLPKLECGMGCGRTFCSPEGRDHHEELCQGPTPKIKGEH